VAESEAAGVRQQTGQIIGPVAPLHTGTESLRTRRWRKPDSNLYGAFPVK
jgi:hypothetical protein